MTNEKKSSDLVWYVAYGSNMLRERFMHYIDGGSYQGRGLDLPAATDQEPPREVRTYDIPYDMYFRNHSIEWGGGGIAFLDINKPGQALGVAYLISREQMDHVALQENGGFQPALPEWYNRIVQLPDLEGREVYSLANAKAENYSAPAKPYRDTIAAGLAENYPEMTGAEIDSYLESCVRA